MRKRNTVEVVQIDGEQLRKELSELGLNLSDASKKLGKHPTYLASHVTNIDQMPLSLSYAIKGAFGIDLDDYRKKPKGSKEEEVKIPQTENINLEDLVNAINNHAEAMSCISQGIKEMADVMREFVVCTCTRDALGNTPEHPTIIIRREEE